MQVQEAHTDHPRLALEALSTAQELCAKAAGSRGTRQAYFIGQLMADEHLAAGDAATANRLLLLVAGQAQNITAPPPQQFPQAFP